MSTGRLIIAPESPPATPPTSSQASASRFVAPKARASFDVQAVMPRHVPGAQGARSYRERDGAMFPFDEDMHHQNTRPTESVDATSSPGHSGRAQSNYSSYPPTNNLYNHHDYFTPPTRRNRTRHNNRPRRNNQRASAPISIPSDTKRQEQLDSQKRQAELDRQRDTARKNEKDKQKKERKDSAVAASSLGSANNGGSSSNSLDD